MASTFPNSRDLEEKEREKRTSTTFVTAISSFFLRQTIRHSPQVSGVSKMQDVLRSSSEVIRSVTEGRGEADAFTCLFGLRRDGFGSLKDTSKERPGGPRSGLSLNLKRCHLSLMLPSKCNLRQSFGESTKFERKGASHKSTGRKSDGPDFLSVRLHLFRKIERSFEASATASYLYRRSSTIKSSHE